MNKAPYVIIETDPPYEKTENVFDAMLAVLGDPDDGAGLTVRETWKRTADGVVNQTIVTVNCGLSLGQLDEAAAVFGVRDLELEPFEGRGLLLRFSTVM
jgi:hypothetical protein